MAIFALKMAASVAREKQVVTSFEWFDLEAPERGFTYIP